MEAAESLGAEGLASRGEGEEDEGDEQTCEHKNIEINTTLKKNTTLNILQ